MPRISKPKESTPVDQNATTSPAVTTTPVVKPVVEKVVKPKKEKAVVKVESETNVPVTSDLVSTPVVPTEDVVDTTDLEASISAQSVEFMAKLNQLGVIVSSLKNEYRTLEKKFNRELKVAQKANSKRKRKSGNRAPSGFVKPTRISDELAKFLEKPTGSEMARTDVTREINKYIRAHNLQDKDNGRKINPDTKLSTLLKLKKTDELTYFNLQKFMSPHFSKNEKVVTATATSVSATASV
jgi:upstream activation factor subunit UAF30